MKGIICYYSGSGNTKLAIEYLRKKITVGEFELLDITKKSIPDFSKYDIAGFATFADFGGPPQLMYDFIKKVKKQKNKPAFVFNTYGFISVHTLKQLGELVTSNGFNVILGFSLHTPENYPPMRNNKMAFDNAPKPKELRNFDSFINELEEKMKSVKSGQQLEPQKLKSGFMGLVFPKFPRTQSKKDFGIQQVQNELCVECGICKKVCPYDAVELNPKPIFDHKKCHGCWACYNHCSKKAIITPKFKGEHQYAKPNSQMIKKLG